MHRPSPLRIVFILPALAWLVSLACTTVLPIPQNTPTSPPVETPAGPPQPTPMPQTDITFQVEIPADSPSEEPVFINILDEVTGLALSAQAFPMEYLDEQHYQIVLPFAFGTIVKYRYSRLGAAAPVEEHISDGRQLRYRMLHVEGPGQVNDVVSRWTDTQFNAPTGRIMGHVLDATTGQPIPGLLVVAGGSQALTASDGSYLLEGLPPGTHNLVAYALDGAYQIFQQGALVAGDSTTPAELRLNPSRMVNVTFVVDVPEDTIPAVPIRLAGNLRQLGNTFADLAGGVNGIASRMPLLSLLPEGQLVLSMPLPVGADIRYLYTLGDGFWNTELNADGSRRLRQLIVPEGDITLFDSIESWRPAGEAAITFDVTVPTNTPPGDTVSIQFNPLFGWMEPIPMWRLGENRWAYVLNHPLQTISAAHYRYCRNDQCGAADDGETPGPQNSGYPLSSGLMEQTMIDDVRQWAWMSAVPPQASVDAVEVLPHGAEFVAGVEFQASYHPSWPGLTAPAVETVRGLGANWLTLTPTWTYTRRANPILEPVSGTDTPWDDLLATAASVRQGGLNLAIFPTPHFPIEARQWWIESRRDFPWWVVWFDRYRAFILHHADLAVNSNSQALILGGDWISPALQGGTLPDGSPSGVPADADARWRSLIAEIRQRYSGKIWFAIPFDLAAGSPPDFLDAVDGIYVLFGWRLSTQPNPARADMAAEAAMLLDGAVGPVQLRFNKPIYVGITYPSADGAATGCLASPSGGCLNPNLLAPPSADRPEISLDLGEQSDIYAALLQVVNQRAWISGVFTRAYYPPADLQDKSLSIHGKPAQEVVRYWFLRWLGSVQ